MDADKVMVDAVKVKTFEVQGSKFKVQSWEHVPQLDRVVAAVFNFELRTQNYF